MPGDGGRGWDATFPYLAHRMLVLADWQQGGYPTCLQSHYHDYVYLPLQSPLSYHLLLTTPQTGTHHYNTAWSIFQFLLNPLLQMTAFGSVMVSWWGRYLQELPAAKRHYTILAHSNTLSNITLFKTLLKYTTLILIWSHHIRRPGSLPTQNQWLWFVFQQTYNVFIHGLTLCFMPDQTAINVIVFVKHQMWCVHMSDCDNEWCAKCTAAVGYICI